MASPNKTGVVLVPATSVPAATVHVSGARDVSTKFGALIMLRVSNGATGPTNACRASVQVRSSATGDWYEWRSFLADNADGAISEFVERVPLEGFEYRARFAGHTGQAVTVQAETVEVDSIT